YNLTSNVLICNYQNTECDEIGGAGAIRRKDHTCLDMTFSMDDIARFPHPGIDDACCPTTTNDKGQ
ncbi:MAG TPA: hypothetical protein DD465_21070, partial [Thalassospira sp.]|nr:hypothetical protein [Thalassospira sp.]